MKHFDSLYRKIAHLLVENDIQWISGVKGLRRPIKKTFTGTRVLQKISLHMKCCEYQACTKKGENPLSKHQTIRVEINSETLQICACHLYMLSKTIDTSGLILFSNGDVYKGCIKNGIVNGPGVYYFLNGDSLHGFFNNGKPTEGMVYIWKTLDSIFVEYHNAICARFVQVWLRNEIFEVISQSMTSNLDVLMLKYSIQLKKNTCVPLLSHNKFPDEHSIKILVE